MFKKSLISRRQLGDDLDDVCGRAPYAPPPGRRLVRRITSLFLGARLRGDLRFLSLSAVFGGEVLESLARALVGSLARHLLKAQGPIPKFVRPAERHYLKVELIS
jgi:hypothetical protein